MHLSPCKHLSRTIQMPPAGTFTANDSSHGELTQLSDSGLIVEFNGHFIPCPIRSEEDRFGQRLGIERAKNAIQLVSPITFAAVSLCDDGGFVKCAFGGSVCLTLGAFGGDYGFVSNTLCGSIGLTLGAFGGDCGFVPCALGGGVGLTLGAFGGDCGFATLQPA